MSSKVVISGDDFGISEAFSIGSLLAAKRGVVSVLAFMVNLPSSEVALRWKKSLAPEVPLALHFNVVLGKPVCDPKDVPSLVDERGYFYRSFAWRSDDPDDEKCKGTVSPRYEDIVKELAAQIERFYDLVGSYPVHIDSHSVFNQAIARAFSFMAERCGTHCEGFPDARPDLMVSCGEPRPVGGTRARAALTNRGCSVQDWQDDAFGIVSCPYDIAVVHLHPGYIDQELLDSTSLTLPRCRDFATLTCDTVRSWLEAQNIEPVSYDAVYKTGFVGPSKADVADLYAEGVQ